MIRVIRNALIYTAGNVATAAVPFFLMPVLTRVLTAEQYGVVSMFAALLVVLTTLVTLNVHSAIPVRVFDRAAGTDISPYVGSCVLVVACSGAVIFVLTWLLKAPIITLTSLPESWVLVAVVIATANGLMQIRLALWIAEEKAAAYAAYQVSRTLLEFTLALYLVVILTMGADGRLWSQSAAIAIFGAIGLISLSLKRQNITPRAILVRDALAFGAPLIPHSIGLFLLSAGDRFIINLLLGIEQVGIYTVAVQIGLGMALVMDAFNRAFVPWLYRHLRDGKPQKLREIVTYTWIGFALLLSVAGLVGLSSTWIIRIIAGPAFADAAKPLAWIAIGQAFHGMYLLVTNYSFYTKRTVHLAASTLTSGVAGLVLVYVLAPIFGITGGGIAFAIAMLLKFLLTWALAQRAYPMPWFAGFR